MYSEDDLNSAVAAGALSAEAAASFRNHMTKVRELPRGSEENFRLINSFNDIFVAIGIVILLIAVGAIGQAVAGVIMPSPVYPFENWSFSTGYPPSYDQQMAAWRAEREASEALGFSLSGLLVAVTAWPLAEFFTRKRRMALPSIILLLSFVGGIFFTLFGAGAALGLSGEELVGAIAIVLSGAVACVGAYLHWRRFKVPITIAAAVGIVVISLLIALLALLQIQPDSSAFLVPVLISGLGIFTFAMRWDISDRDRITRRSDVAFWLHLLAAPMIAHPVFALFGVTDGDNLGVGAAIGVLATYIAFGLVALAIDRRALLVSALAYVLFALTFLFREFGAVELGFALTALVIGSALLSLSAFWQPIRHKVVTALPEDIQAKLPATTDTPLSTNAASPA